MTSGNTLSDMPRINVAGGAGVALLFMLVNTGKAVTTAASARSSSSRAHIERKDGAGRWEGDAAKLSRLPPKEHLCGPDRRRTWEAALFCGVRPSSCNLEATSPKQRVDSPNTTLSHPSGGSEPSTSKSSCRALPVEATATRLETTSKRNSNNDRGGTNGLWTAHLLAGIRGGSGSRGEGRGNAAGKKAGSKKAPPPQRLSRAGAGRRRGDARWDEEDEGMYDDDFLYEDEEHDDEFDLRDNYEDGVDDEIYRRKGLRDSYEDDDLSADYDDDLEDYDDDSDEREDDYDDYDAYDEDEFDDDLDDDTYGRSRRGGSAGRQAPGRPSARGGVTRTRGPRRRGRKVASPGIQRIKETLIGAQENLKTTMSSVTHRGAKVMRELKGSISSDLEKTLIKATRPDDDPAKRKHVNLVLQAADHAFPGYMDPQDKSLSLWREGPYWMTLHKLWRRMAEKDYRTAAKAVYVLHRVARDTTVESWGYFRATLVQMRRVEDRGTKSRYFSRRVIRNVDSEGQSHAEWLDSYAEFVLLRLQSFSPDLSDLAAVDSETSLEDASRSLEKAERLIDAALACELGPEQDNDVTCDCLKLVVEDLCELWSYFQENLKIRLQQQQRSAAGGISSGELRQTAGFLEFYLDHLTRARDLVRNSHRLLTLYSHAVPRGLGDTLAEGMLEERLACIQDALTTDKIKPKITSKASIGAGESAKAREAKGKRAGEAGRQPIGAATAPVRKTPEPAAAAASTDVSPKKRAQKPAVRNCISGSKASATTGPMSTAAPTPVVPQTPATGKKRKADGDTPSVFSSGGGAGGGLNGEKKYAMGGNGEGEKRAPTSSSSTPVTGKKIKKKKKSLPDSKMAGVGGRKSTPPSA